MIFFSPAKINLGLQILERRADGFHNLRSIMYPIGLCDIIEINQQAVEGVPLQFTQSGIHLESDQEKNLCFTAWELMASETEIPNAAIHLHKQIPVGAGLGGGSSNASTILMGLNLMAGSPVSYERVAEMAERLGSDCPFFLQKDPMLMEGRGERLSRVKISLHQYFLVILFPHIHISTASAYATVTPAIPEHHLGRLIEAPVNSWRRLIINDFEKSIFLKHPLLEELKRALYNEGALYASMSGSGSSLFGIFQTPPELPDGIQRYVVWSGPA